MPIAVAVLLEDHEAGYSIANFGSACTAGGGRATCEGSGPQGDAGVQLHATELGTPLTRKRTPIQDIPLLMQLIEHTQKILAEPSVPAPSEGDTVSDSIPTQDRPTLSCASGQQASSGHVGWAR